MEISVFGKSEKYKLLYVLEFTSKRKRMSVIVTDDKGNVYLFCKGADSIIYERLTAESKDRFENIYTLIKKLF